MTLLVTDAPEAAAVSLDEAKRHCRVTETDQDGLLTDAIAAATEWVEVFTRRSLVARDLELRLDCWPRDGEIVLPQGPVSEVATVKYLDTAGVLRTLDEDLYVVAGIDAPSSPGRIVPAPGYSWPALWAAPEAVRIAYTAGFETIPSRFKRAILLLVGDMYEHRERTITGTIVATIDTCERLLWSVRVLEAA